MRKNTIRKNTVGRMTAMILSAALVTGATGVSAQAGLQNEKDINTGLLAAAAAEKIQRECDTISPRWFRARAYMNELKSMATARGYSEAEIEAYVSNDAEKAKMRERRNRYFAAHGASNKNPQSLCVLGHQEIARNSQIGVLLRAR